MTDEKIEKIAIGAAFQWQTDEHQASPRTDDLTTGFRVNGADADLTRTGPRNEEWEYRLRHEGKEPTVSKESYKTKELALEGLKHYLLKRG